MKRGRRNRYLITLVMSLAIVLAACGATNPDATTTTAASGAESGGGGGDESTTTSEATAAPAENGPGVSAEEVRVAFIVTDLERVQKALGLDVPSQGDLEAQILAITDYINANGGIGGRTMVPFVRPFDALLDSPTVEEELCNGITQDDQVFAVVMTGQFQDNARPCYAARNTLMLDTTFYPIDQDGYEELAPYLWSYHLTEYPTMMGGLVAGLAFSGWFEGSTLGILGADNELSHKAYDETVKPLLDELGVTVAEEQWVDATDTATLQPGIDQAVLAFKAAEITHVVTIGGSRIQPFFMQSAEFQNYQPIYAMTSYDSPDFSINSYPDSMPGAAGVSMVPGFDVADDQHPFPANETEELCVSILESTGETFDERKHARVGIQYCDAALLLQKASEGLTDALNASLWRDAVWELGDSFQLGTTYETLFLPGSYTGANAFRVTAFNAECSCLELQSGPQPFPREAGS
ncbi:MAG: ABC transporter substrate-binding protein [Acidimicrobiia bacterium]